MPVTLVLNDETNTVLLTETNTIVVSSATTPGPPPRQVATGIAGATSLSNSLSDADDVVDAIVDMAAHMDDIGLALDGVLVDRDTFKSLLHMEAPERILKVSAAGDNKVGSATLTSLSGDIAGVKVTALWNGAPSTFAGYDSTAVKTLTSGGPTRLTAENIVALTQDVSVYGYVATATVKPSGFIKA